MSQPSSVSELQDAVRQHLQVILSRAGILRYVAGMKSDAEESYAAIERAVRQIDVLLSPQAIPKGTTNADETDPQNAPARP